MQSYKKISKAILNYDLEYFISKYLGEDLTKVTFQLSKKIDSEELGLLIDQLKLYKKARSKFPTFTKAFCFFTTKSFEQATSEHLAKFKSSLFKGNTLLDISGGLGVDDWAFSNTFSKIISLDKDDMLNEIVRRNFEKLGITNVERLDIDAYEFIQSFMQFDLIYLDADRRSNDRNERLIGLSYSEPNILEIKSRLFEISDKILIKLSPMIDINELLNEINEVSDVYVISLDNEVKEVLALLKKESEVTPTICAINLHEGKQQEFSAKLHQNEEILFSDEGSFFYEPSLSLIKSGISMVYAMNHQLFMIAKNSYFFISDNIVNNFFGRSFKIVSKIEFSKSKVKKYLSENGIIKGNISKRNFPATVDELKEVFSIKDGGEEYLFFTQNESKQKLMFHCRKIN